MLGSYYVTIDILIRKEKKYCSVIPNVEQNSALLFQFSEKNSQIFLLQFWILHKKDTMDPCPVEHYLMLKGFWDNMISRAHDFF